nr:hypothetical protein HmN_000597900 [Hymenolepis microstoma]
MRVHDRFHRLIQIASFTRISLVTLPGRLIVSELHPIDSQVTAKPRVMTTRSRESIVAAVFFDAIDTTPGHLKCKSSNTNVIEKVSRIRTDSTP